jgi:hypothetical protein
MLNHKVFGGKQFGELGLDFVIDGHWFCFGCTYHTKKGGLATPWCASLESVLNF